MTEREEDSFEQLVADAIWRSLLADEKTREPMNALLVWTELGRGLAGTLERKGADLGALRRVIDGYCHAASQHATVDLGRWVYRVESDQRLSANDVAGRLRAIEEEIEKSIAALLHESPGGDAQKTIFLTVVKGWFPVGLQIFRALPLGHDASEPILLGALGAWCRRYLPEDPAGPGDLGIRVER